MQDKEAEMAVEIAEVLQSSGGHWYSLDWSVNSNKFIIRQQIPQDDTEDNEHTDLVYEVTVKLVKTEDKDRQKELDELTAEVTKLKSVIRELEPIANEFFQLRNEALGRKKEAMKLAEYCDHIFTCYQNAMSTIEGCIRESQ